MLTEKVLNERDGTDSLIRLYDKIISTEDVQREIARQGIQYPVKLYLKLYAGGARGKEQVTVQPQSPAGLNLPATQFSVTFQDENDIFTVVLDLALPIAIEGLYRFSVLVGDRLLTQVPFRVLYQGFRPAS
jgi:hypothetical protein